MKYTYQLVLQFPASSLTDYDAMIELEDRISGRIGSLGHVDGHDMGCGEFNIFVHTNHPKPTFEGIKALPEMKDFMPELKSGYRKFGEDDHTVMYPPGLDRFTVM